MIPISRSDFTKMSLAQVAEHHGMKFHDFISEVYPVTIFIKESEHFYKAYVHWCGTKTALGKLL